MIKTQVLRRERLDDRDVDLRLSICKRCPGGHVVLKPNGLPLSCGKLLNGTENGAEGRPCGCLLRQKARDATQSCPFGYWPDFYALVSTEPAVESPASVPQSKAHAAPSSVPSVQDHATQNRAAQGNGQPTTIDTETLATGRIRMFLDIGEMRQRKSERRLRGQKDEFVPLHPKKEPIKNTPAASPQWPTKSLFEFFDRVVVVNLDRRPDRLAQLQQHLSDIGWPFRYPERFRAVDGKFVKPPIWWRAGPNAWGCQQSHLQIMEKAMMDGIESVLILEDDVFFDQNFRQRVEKFLSAVPNDWQQIYFGGQHLLQRKQLPVRINEEVIIPFNVNRTHAFAIHKRGLSPIYRWLTDYVTHSKKPDQHVDHRFGQLHETQRIKVYAPVAWLAGQAEGQSNIIGRHLPSRLWHQHQFVDHTQTFVAVLGLHRSGSSALAGVLHKLGVHMGDRLGGFEKTGGFEAVGLSRLCEKAYPFPDTELKIEPGWLRYQLSGHIRHVQRSAKAKGLIAGGKYPHLCAMGEDLQAVCGQGLKVIHIDRPLDESIASLITRSKKSTGWLRANPKQAETVQRWLWESKGQFLKKCPHLHIDYDQLLEDPSGVIQRIIEYLGISPSQRQRTAAIEHIRPALATHRKERSA